MRKIIFILIALVGFQTKMTAQNLSFKTWMGASYEQKVKIKKFKFDVSVAQQLRISDLGYVPKYSTFTELGVSKGITDFYKIGIDYRATYIGGFKNRLSLSNSFKVNLDPITLDFRLKYQANFEARKPFSQDLRLKTTVSYKANKDFSPYVFGEILFHNTYNFSNFDEYRVGFGLEADYKKEHRFDVMLMMAQDLNLENPGRSIVLALEYKFSKESKKKAKK